MWESQDLFRHTDVKEKSSMAFKFALGERIRIQKRENPFQIKVGKQRNDKYWIAGPAATSRPRSGAMKVGTEQGERRNKCFPISSYASCCILVGVHWLDKAHDSTALKFPQGSFTVPDMLHKLIPNWGEIASILAQRGFLTELYHRSQEAQKHSRAWILINPFLPKRHTPPFFLPMLYLQCNNTTDVERILSLFKIDQREKNIIYVCVCIYI